MEKHKFLTFMGKRIQCLNGHRVQKLSLSFLVLLMSLSNFSSAFDSLIND